MSYLYVQRLVNYLRNLSGDEPKLAKYVPDVEYALPPSASILHQFKNGAVCSDSEICSRIGRFVPKCIKQSAIDYLGHLK